MAETFAAAAAGCTRFRATQAPAGAWLFGIAANKLRESLRRGRVKAVARRRLGLEPIELEDGDLRDVVDNTFAFEVPGTTDDFFRATVTWLDASGAVIRESPG